MKNKLKFISVALVGSLGIAATYYVAQDMKVVGNLFVTGTHTTRQILISNTNGAVPGIIITNGGITVMGGVSYFDQATAAISSNSTYFASGLINVYKDGSMTWANDAAGVSSNGVWRGSGAELTNIPTNFPNLNVTNKASVGSLSVGGTDMFVVPDFSTNTYTGSNVFTVLTNGGWQTTVITNDVQWMPSGTGLGTHELIASGGDWKVGVSTNFHRYTTNGLTLVATNYQFTIPSGKHALLSEVAPAPDRRNWGFIIEP